MKTGAIRQGDVMLFPQPVPKNAKKIPLRSIALGEVTGHHHSFVAQPGVCLEDAVEMFEVEDGTGKKTYVRITAEGVSLQHQQHKPHGGAEVLPVGAEFVYIPQVENSEWGTRQVAD
jgi:hypothetical protein